MITADASNLALFWAGVIAFAILVYVILDGFDLGVGILTAAAKNETQRDEMVAAIAPFWDGNETWLVLIGATLFAAFPTTYAVFLPAFYIPVLLLLLGLIFRGVAFEFRYRGARKFWNRGFFLGSAVAAFVQGAAVGAMIRGIPVVDGQYAGGARFIALLLRQRSRRSLRVRLFSMGRSVLARAVGDDIAPTGLLAQLNRFPCLRDRADLV